MVGVVGDQLDLTYSSLRDFGWDHGTQWAVLHGG
jgi:hypothetical protein